MAPPRKHHLGSWVVAPTGQIVKVDFYWPRYRRPESWHAYYALSDGTYVRHDYVRPFKGIVITKEGIVKQAGHPRHGLYIITGGRPTFFRWQRRPRVSTLKRWPQIAACVEWFISGSPQSRRYLSKTSSELLPA